MPSTDPQDSGNQRPTASKDQDTPYFNAIPPGGSWAPNPDADGSGRSRIVNGLPSGTFYTFPANFSSPMGLAPHLQVPESSSAFPPTSRVPPALVPTTGPLALAPMPVPFQQHTVNHCPPPTLASDIPQDDSESEDLPTVDQLLAKIGRPTSKVAGSRRADPKGKGKAKAPSDGPVASGSRSDKRKVPPTLSAQPETKRARGRATGAANYTPTDIDILLDAAEEILPLGGTGWVEVERLFNQRAEELGRPSRTLKSLELKLKQLVKTLKPTGDAECPPHVTRAYKIDLAIAEKADIVDVIDDPNDDDDDKPDSDKPGSKCAAASYVATRPDRLKSTSTSLTRGTGQALLTNISAALDPSARQARQDALSLQQIQSNQIFQLSSQLRDTQRRADTIAAQLVESERHVREAERRHQEAERRADRAEMLGMISARTPHHSPPSSSFHSHFPSPPRRRRYRQEIHYSDGGRATRWIGSASDDESDLYGLNDSPGTRRYTYPDDSDSPTPHLHVQSPRFPELPAPAIPLASTSTSTEPSLQNDAPPVPPRLRVHTTSDVATSDDSFLNPCNKHLSK